MSRRRAAVARSIGEIRRAYDRAIEPMRALFDSYRTRCFSRCRCCSRWVLRIQRYHADLCRNDLVPCLAAPTAHAYDVVAVVRGGRNDWQDCAVLGPRPP